MMGDETVSQRERKRESIETLENTRYLQTIGVVISLAAAYHYFFLLLLFFFLPDVEYQLSF